MKLLIQLLRATSKYSYLKHATVMTLLSSSSMAVAQSTGNNIITAACSADTTEPQDMLIQLLTVLVPYIIGVLQAKQKTLKQSAND